MQYTKATLLAHSKEVHDDGSIVEVIIWELLEPLPPSEHRFKYRLYFGSANECRIRYDNERGKGDHRHVGQKEDDDLFSSIERLLDDFERDIAGWSSS